MARIRTVKPEFWTDERLTECSLSARLMFIGMLNFADDNGNMPNSPKRLKMQIFPADSIDTAPLLLELLTHGLLIEYSVNGEKYLHIKGFRKHQVINRPSKSDIPTPNFNEDSVNTHGGLSDGKEGKGKERNTPSIPLSGEVDVGFDRFWSIYPRKVGKDAARKAFAKRKFSEEKLEQVLAAIAVQAKCEQWRKDGGQYVPHPSTWLNEGRWQDEVSANTPMDQGVMTAADRDAMDDANPRPQWVLDAGFANVWEARNDGCNERTWRHFRDGKRVEVAA